jgi:hypothetical protein
MSARPCPNVCLESTCGQLRYILNDFEAEFTGSIGSNIDGAMLFATSSLTFRMVCRSVRILSVKRSPTLRSAVVDAVASSARDIF